MFETAELGQKIGKREYREAVPALRTDLLRVQNELRVRRDFAVVIVVAGVDGAGKGQTVNVLHTWMDPRYLETHVLTRPTIEERERPRLWRFWRELPRKGRIGVFFGSWITAPILSRVYGETGDADLAAAIDEIEAFERQLTDAGVLLLKFWFHLSKKAQRKRLKGLSKDPENAWRVTDDERRHFEMYDDFATVSERVEGFASPGEWRRAYREINDFEQLLHDHGYGLAKVWLHIDKDEQAQRFAEREQTPYKTYKITEEDYRNRERWELYEDAVNEMVERTSTAHGPWTLVEGNDKRYARIKVVNLVSDVLADALARAARRSREKKGKSRLERSLR